MNLPESPIAPPNNTAFDLLIKVKVCPNLEAGISPTGWVFTYWYANSAIQV